jgi:hypothetical protein
LEGRDRKILNDWGKQKIELLEAEEEEDEKRDLMVEDDNEL